MALFWKYLKGRRKIFGAGMVFVLIFAVVFWLYHLPPGAVAYPAALCILVGGIMILFDYRSVCRRHMELKRLSSLNAVMTEELPKAEGLTEEDYQNLICMLQSQVGELGTEADNRYRDMVEYYTLWAHQIKTPIASMRLQLQNTDSAESRRLLAELFRIEQYVEMVLAFLRLGSVSKDYVFKEYPLDDIIRQAVKKFTHEFIERKIRLEYEPVEKAVVTDEKWLSFVLEQMISNALKYTRKGSVKIYFSNGDTLNIEDTGIGIAPQDLPRIFENGYTGYNGRADKRASGIGLYLCKKVCDNLGIAVTVQSEVGKGTNFQLCFNQYRIKKE